MAPPGGGGRSVGGEGAARPHPGQHPARLPRALAWCLRLNTSHKAALGAGEALVDTQPSPAGAKHTSESCWRWHNRVPKLSDHFFFGWEAGSRAEPLREGSF